MSSTAAGSDLDSAGDSDPRQVFLFTGHMIDAPGRLRPRFPADLEGAAARAIAAEIDRWGGAPGDVGLCGGAAGGDLIFAEVCLVRGLRLEIVLPFEEEQFLERSVVPSGPEWRGRFASVKQGDDVRVKVERSAALGSESPYSRTNRKLLARATRWGTERLVVIALWDGRPGDGAGGTAEMVAAARSVTNRVRIIDPAALRRAP